MVWLLKVTFQIPLNTYNFWLEILMSNGHSSWSRGLVDAEGADSRAARKHGPSARNAPEAVQKHTRTDGDETL